LNQKDQTMNVTDYRILPYTGAMSQQIMEHRLDGHTHGVRPDTDDMTSDRARPARRSLASLVRFLAPWRRSSKAATARAGSAVLAERSPGLVGDVPAPGGR
jgi:hypothetical protein